MRKLLRLFASTIQHLANYPNCYMCYEKNPKNFVEHQFGYQQDHEESVVLVIDLAALMKLRSTPMSPFAAPPCLVRAYRISDGAMALYDNGTFTAATMRQHNLNFDNIFEQLPVYVHNSDLGNIMLHQIDHCGPWSTAKSSLRSLSNPSSKSLAGGIGPSSGNSDYTLTAMQRTLTDIGTCAEELASESMRLVSYYTQVGRYSQQRQQYMAKRDAENRARMQRGEAPLADDEGYGHSLKPPVATNQLPALLLASQLGQTAAEASKLAAGAALRIGAASSVAPKV